MLSLALILLREFFDNTFKTEDDIRVTLDLPVITSLPEISKDGDTIITSKTPFDYREAFKVLRTKIQFSGIDGRMKVIGVKVRVRFEGKTTVHHMALTIRDRKPRFCMWIRTKENEVHKTLNLRQNRHLECAYPTGTSRKRDQQKRGI
jgi:hypothetical protein